MKWLEIKVIIESAHPQMAADLISQVFHDEGVRGVMIEDPDLMPAESWGKDAVRAIQHAVIGFIAHNEQSKNLYQRLTTRLHKVAQTQGDTINILYRLMDEEDWSHSWKDFFWPERITNRIVVKPSWREYSPKSEDIIIEIDPGMAFGTGTHPTTSMCIELIEKYIQKGDSFLDVGTGSGILMIAAAKLGATPIWGIDNDAVAVSIAIENLRLNGIDVSQAQVTEGNLVHGHPHQYSMIAANILAAVIIELLDDLIPVIAPRGRFICSGIVAKDQDMVIQRIQRCHLDILEVLARNEWVAIAAQRLT
jgi:ribosomal protein L11 methyltransferase